MHALPGCLPCEPTGSPRRGFGPARAGRNDAAWRSATWARPGLTSEAAVHWPVCRPPGPGLYQYAPCGCQQRWEPVATRKRLRRHPGSVGVHNVSMVTDVVAIVGLFGVIASVFLLFFQTRANVQQAKISNDQAKVSNNIACATVISNASSNLHEVFQVFIDHPELWPYFYESKNPPLRGHKRVRINVVAETLGDVFEDGLVAHSLIPTSRSSEDWVRYCRLVLTASPIMNEILQSNPEWWPELRKATSRNSAL